MRLFRDTVGIVFQTERGDDLFLNEKKNQLNSAMERSTRANRINSIHKNYKQCLDLNTFYLNFLDYLT